MEPEIQLEELKLASQDLQKADIWSSGLLMYSLINPNLTNPYGVNLNKLEYHARFTETKAVA